MQNMGKMFKSQFVEKMCVMEIPWNVWNYTKLMFSIPSHPQGVCAQSIKNVLLEIAWNAQNSTEI